jgi:hypothetical protein
MLQQPALAEDSPLQLLVPSLAQLDAYTDALKRNWSPDKYPAGRGRDGGAGAHRPGSGGLRGLARRPRGRGRPITLPEGSQVPRLPGYRRWIWDDGFYRSINLRWQPGTVALPPNCPGHIGYAVAPWKRGRGYATRASAMLPSGWRT